MKYGGALPEIRRRVAAKATLGRWLSNVTTSSFRPSSEDRDLLMQSCEMSVHVEVVVSEEMRDLIETKKKKKI